MNNEITIAAVASAAGLALGAAAVRIWLSGKLRGAERALLEKESELNAERLAREADRRACENALRERDASCSRMLEERERACRQVVEEKESALKRLLESKDREFAEMTKTLEVKFANLAALTLEAKSKDLTTANRTSLEAAIKPLAEQMEKFQAATQKAQNDNRDMGNAIHKDIESIGRYARDLSEFSVAIKAGNTVQGRKGEDILAEKLRQAGLEENVTFFLQEGTGTDRPDAQVCDAENRWLIIDSKVSMTAYVDYRNGQLDEATRRQRLKDHVVSVRGRIESLRDKKYPEAFSKRYPDRNYLPVAAMFVPYEAALTAALEEDPSLWQVALQGNVVLLTPMTLIAYCRLVYLAWQNRKVEQKYQEVVKTAEELLARMNGFLLAFEGVGSAIADARTQYDAAWKVLVDHRNGQTIGGSARKLIEANVRLLNKKGEKKATAGCLAE